MALAKQRDDKLTPVTIEFSGEVWFWKGPAPWYFLTVPEGQSAEIKDVANLITYGWGMIPVTARIGDSEWTTALWPKDGKYVLPIKTIVRRAQGIDEGDLITAQLDVAIAQ
jgi:hypothetical protein